MYIIYNIHKYKTNKNVTSNKKITTTKKYT